LTSAQNVGIWVEQPGAQSDPVGLFLLNYYVTSKPFDSDPLIAGLAGDSLFDDLNATLVGDNVAFGGALWDVYSVDFLFDVTPDPVPQLAAGNYWFEIAALSDYIPEDAEDPFQSRVLWDWVNPSPAPVQNTALIISAVDEDTGQVTATASAPANSFQLVGEIAAADAPELDPKCALVPLASTALLFGLLLDRRKKSVI
jgi:hypothetical protein